MVLDTIKVKVNDYMSSDPISVEPEFKLLDAIYVMAEKNIGNLIINKDNKPSTILTEREILTYLVKEGKIPDIRVKDAPTKPFVVITPDHSVIEASSIMIEGKKRLLVFDNNKLVGIITASDMLRGLRTTGGNPPLDDVMSKKVFDCVYHDSIFKAIKLMYKKKIGSVIISKNNLPHGIFRARLVGACPYQAN